MLHSRNNTDGNKFMILLGVELYKSDTYIERRLSATNLSSDNNLLTFRLNVPVVIMMITFSLFMQQPTEKPLKDTKHYSVLSLPLSLFLSSESKRKTQAAKLKCILCYFSQVAGRDLQGTITLRRQVKDIPYEK